MRSDIANNEGGFDKKAITTAVLNSGVLGTSNHQIQLFLYLINAKHSGTIDRVKAYNIAVDAFGRSQDFDGSVDSIVRVEMFRLRANLKTFNNQSNSYQILLPKGTYNLSVEEQSKPHGNLTSSGSKRQKSMFKRNWTKSLVTILPILMLGTFIVFADAKKRSELESCSNIVPNIEIVNKSQTYELELYVGQILKGAASQFSHLNVVDDAQVCLETGIPSYAIEYTIFQDETTYRGNLALKSYADGDILAVQNPSGNLKTKELDVEFVSDDLYYSALRIVNDWLNPNGIVHRDAVKSEWADNERQLDYSCIALMHASHVSDASSDYNRAQKCLKLAYSNKTRIVDNLGGLAVSYIEEGQGLRPPTVENPLVLAEEIIALIGDDWDKFVETTVAKIYFEAEREDFNSQRMRDVLLIAEKKYSSNPIILLYIAYYQGFRLGDWHYAGRLNAKVKRLQSARDNSIYFLDAANAIMTQDFNEPMNICIKTYSENSELSNLLINACAVMVNDINWARKTEENLNRLGIITEKEKLDFFENRRFNEEFRNKLKQIWQIQS